MTFHEGCASEAIYSRKTRANDICASSEKRLVEDYSRSAAREWSSSLGRYTRTSAKSPLFSRGTGELQSPDVPSSSEKSRREGGGHGRS
jgi:hypothetical protein